MYGLNPVRRLVFSVAVPVPVFITYHLVCDVWFRLFCLVSPRMKYSCNSMPYEISWTYRSPVALNIHAVLTHTADFQPSFKARIPDFEQSHARWRTISRPLYTHQASRCFFSVWLFQMCLLSADKQRTFLVLCSWILAVHVVKWLHFESAAAVSLDTWDKKNEERKKKTCMKIQQLLFFKHQICALSSLQFNILAINLNRI